jgi:hypothetical protein
LRSFFSLFLINDAFSDGQAKISQAIAKIFLINDGNIWSDLFRCGRLGGKVEDC